MTTYTTAEIRNKIDLLPRCRLAKLPSPLDHCPRLSEHLAGPAVYMKREDLTDLAFGGNKARMIEFIFGRAFQQVADCFVKTETCHSNFDRMLAAAGARTGIKMFLVAKPHPALDESVQGNHLLIRLFGTTIVLPDRYDCSGPKEALAKLRQDLAGQGFRPYCFGHHDRILSSVAYIECLLEILRQRDWPDGAPDAIVCSSHGPSQAGLAIEAKALGLRTRIMGVRPEKARQRSACRTIAAYANRAATLLDLNTRICEEDVESSGEASGRYHFVNRAAVDALVLLARTEGIPAGPIYVGKALADLFERIRTGRMKGVREVVFIHTGDLPNLFSYAPDIIAHGLSETTLSL